MKVVVLCISYWVISNKATLAQRKQKSCIYMCSKYIYIYIYMYVCMYVCIHTVKEATYEHH